MAVPIPVNSTPSTSTNNSTHSTSSDNTPSSERRGNSSSSLDESSEETPSRKYRSLSETYESCAFALVVSDPTTYEEAAEAEIWQNATKEEIMAIQRNRTWELTDLPEGKYSIRLKWIFETKYHADGIVQKHKAHLVAKGYSQQQGVDFEETFSPVARFETMKTVLALAAQLKWPIYQFDVKSAFLNGELEEEVYVDQPEGFILNGSEGKVYKLKKALYGLKQAPRAWYSKIDHYLQQHGFERSKSEPTL